MLVFLDVDGVLIPLRSRLDDEIADADRRWVAAHHPAPTLLHRVDPHVGLGEADFLAVHDWLSSR